MLCPLINKYTTPAEREAGCYFAEGFESAQSVTNNGWTINGSPVIDNGALFSATGDYLQFVGTTFEVKDAITMIYEVLPKNSCVINNSTNKTFSRSANPDNGFHYLRETSANNFVFAVGNLIIFTVASSLVVPYWKPNERNIMVVTVNLVNGDDRQFFVNGAKLYDSVGAPISNQYVPMNNLTLAADTAGADRFDGKFLSLKVFDRVLTDQEILGYSKGNIRDYLTTSVKPMWKERFINETLLESHFDRELHTSHNCCTPRLEREENNTFGWADGGGGSLSSVDATEIAPVIGDYVLKHTAAGTSDRAEFITNVVSGRKYRISFWAKAGVGTRQRIGAWVNLTDSPSDDVIPSNWTYFEYDVTASSTSATIRIYSSDYLGSSGDTVYIDSFSMLEMPDIQGSPTINNGAEFDGSSDYIVFPTTIIPTDEFSAVIEFNPDFDGNDGNAHYLFDSDSRYFVFKNASDELVIQLANTEIAAISNATWNGYWNKNARNVLVVSSDSVRTDVWLNNNLILDKDTTTWTPTLIETLTFGGEDESSTDAFDGEILSFQIFDRYLEAIDVTGFQSNINHCPNNITAYWLMDAKSHGIDPVSSAVNLLVDGDMETSGVADYTVINSATLTKETISPYEGTQVLRVAYNTTSTPRAQQSILSVGFTYQITGVARSNGVNPPRVYDGGTTIWTGTTSTDWQVFNIIVTAASVGVGFGFAGGSSSASYCEFDDISVVVLLSRTLDISGNNNHATSNAISPAKKTSVHGYHFNYSVSMGTTIVPPQIGSLVAFVEAKPPTGERMIMGSSTSGGTDRCYMGIVSSKFSGGIGNNDWGTIQGGFVSGEDIHTCMMTWDATTVTLYLDGISVYSDAKNGYTGTDFLLYVGANNLSGVHFRGWTGPIYEAGVFYKALTPLEVKDLHISMLRRFNNQ